MTVKDVINKRVALVTGASKGIGREIAIQLAHDGFQVVGSARSIDGLDEVQREVNSFRRSFKGISADLTQRDQVRRLLSEIEAIYGRLDVLVNNAGGTEHFGSFLEIEDESWDRAYALNVLSVVKTVQCSLPLLVKSPSPRIINISSTTAMMPGFFNPHYSAAKAALLNLSKHRSNILADKGVLVNAISVGPVITESWKENVLQLAGKKQLSVEVAHEILLKEEEGKIPLGRIGNTRDVANLVSFLASERATWITGTDINLDGGKSRSIS